MSWCSKKNSNTNWVGIFTSIYLYIYIYIYIYILTCLSIYIDGRTNNPVFPEDKKVSFNPLILFCYRLLHNILLET